MRGHKGLGIFSAAFDVLPLKMSAVPGSPDPSIIRVDNTRYPCIIDPNDRRIWRSWDGGHLQWKNVKSRAEDPEAFMATHSAQARRIERRRFFARSESSSLQSPREA